MGEYIVWRSQVLRLACCLLILCNIALGESSARQAQVRSFQKLMGGLSDDFEKRRALKEYEEKGADVACWADDGTMVKPDNAALLYYRALAHRPEADPCTAEGLRVVMQGGQPDDRVRSYLGRCLPTIELAQLAGQITDCDWGFQYCRRPNQVMDTLMLLRQLAFLLDVHVRTLATDGHYRAAFENCLVNRRLAHHMGDDFWMLYLVSRSVDTLAIFSMRTIVANMPADVNTLTWLREQLTIVEGTPARPRMALEKWYDLEVREWDAYRGDRPFDRAWVLAQINDEDDRQEAMALTDEQLLVRFLSEQRNLYGRANGLTFPDGLLVRARAGYDEFIDSAVAVMESDASYEQKQAQLDGLKREFYERVKRHEPVALLRHQGIDVQRYHEFQVRDAMFLNLLKAAIEVLLVAAETRQAPEALPDGLSKDLFTGEDFQYERTETGFVLGIDPENLSRLRKRRFEFDVNVP